MCDIGSIAALPPESRIRELVWILDGIAYVMVIKQKASRLISLEGHCFSHDFFEDGLLDSIWGRGERKDGREGVEC